MASRMGSRATRGSRRWPSRVEVARAGRRGVRPPGREEDDRGGGGDELGWNGSWAGSAAGERQVSGWASLFFYSFVLFSI